MVCMGFTCLYISNRTAVKSLESDEEFSFFVCLKKTAYYLVKTIQVIFTNAYKLLSDTLNGFSDRNNWLFLQS